MWGPMDLSCRVGQRTSVGFGPNVYVFNFSHIEGHSVLAPRAKQGHSYGAASYAKALMLFQPDHIVEA